MPRRVIILFLDGVGLGDPDPETNPFMHAELPVLRSLLDVPHLTAEYTGAATARAALLGLDACLDVPGLPQSATGQTAILTGHNAPARLGEHYGPYPNPALQTILGQDSLFNTLLAAGQPVAYANAYPTRFLDRVQRGKGRLSANTQAARLAGLKLRSGDDLRQGRAISAFLTNDHWPEPDLLLPRLTDRQAGRQLARLAADHTLTFFEFWYSDLLGHKMNRPESMRILPKLDDFIGGILEESDLSQTLLLVVSDHGNFEDWTIAKHTLNPSLTIVTGAGFERVAPQLRALTDIKPVLSAHIFDGLTAPQAGGLGPA